MQALQQLTYRILPASFLANNTQNQQFLDHFNQYVYQEWSSYYFAYDLLKKEYRRIKHLPTACLTYERQIIIEMKRVHRFLASMLLEIEEDVSVISNTIDALQRTLHSSQSHDELQQAILEEEQRQHDDENATTSLFASFSPKKANEGKDKGSKKKTRGSYKKLGESEGDEDDGDEDVDIEQGKGKATSQKTLRYLAKSMRTISAIARKVETIVLDDDLVGQDKAQRKEKQIDRNIEQAIRSLYTILARCEMFYKLNCYAISKVGKRMEKLYKRRPQRVDTIVEGAGDEEDEDDEEEDASEREDMRDIMHAAMNGAEMQTNVSTHVPRLDGSSDFETVVEDMDASAAQRTAVVNPLVHKILSLDDSMEEVVVGTALAPTTIAALSDVATDSEPSTAAGDSAATFNVLHSSVHVVAGDHHHQQHHHCTAPQKPHPMHRHLQLKIPRQAPHHGLKAEKKAKHKHKTSWKDTPSGRYFYKDFASVGSQIQHFKQKCIEFYSVKFKKSHVELAAYELEFIENKDRNYKDTRSFIGFKFGLILCSILWLASESFGEKNREFDFWNHPSLFVYTTVFNLLLYRLLWGVDIAIWSKYGVNYISILELSNIKSNVLFVINQTTTLMTLFFVSLLIFYRIHETYDGIPENSFLHYGSPLMLIVFAISIQVFQTFFYYTGDSSRGLFNKRVLWNMALAPLVPLTFRDNYAADVLTSFTKVISDTLYASCWLYSGAIFAPGLAYEQSSSSFGTSLIQCKSLTMVQVVAILQLMPLVTRFLQCIRGLYEQNGKLFPVAFNAWKYMLSIIVVVFALEGFADSKQVYLFLVCMVTIYKWWWDITMDWGLFDSMPQSWNELFDYKAWMHKKFLLRSSLMYPHPGIYYVCIVLNLALRFIWVLSLAPMTYLGVLVGAKLSLFMGSMEIIRRSIWGAFRVEWEHVKSVKADTPGFLPTHILRRHEWSRRYGSGKERTTQTRKASKSPITESRYRRGTLWRAILFEHPTDSNDETSSQEHDELEAEPDRDNKKAKKPKAK